MAATPDGRLVHELIVQRLFEVSDDYVADAAQQVQHCQQFELERCFLELNSGVPVLHACLTHCVTGFRISLTKFCRASR